MQHSIEDLKEFFRRADKDNSGALDKRELGKVLREFNYKFTKKELTVSIHSFITMEHKQSLIS